jgi:hypothetical protein
MGIRTHDLPVCSIVPQPNTLPRAPNNPEEHVNIYVAIEICM